MNAATTEIGIRDWHVLGDWRYRFFGTYPEGGFWADARLEYREGWRATIEETNYQGDRDRLAAFIASYAECMQ